MKCGVCGNKILNGAKFCSACGAAVKKEFDKKSKPKINMSGKFKSDVVKKALQKVSGNVIEEQAAADIEEIINDHALGAATSAAATAWIPGVGAGIALSVGVSAFIWTMYVRISGRLGIKLSKKKLKFFCSGMLSELTITVGSALLAVPAASAVSLIPGIGSVAAVLLGAGINYAVVTIGGIVFINVISSLIGEGADISNMSDEELKARMEKVMDGQDVKKMMKEARGEYIKARKAGTVSGEETVELEKE